MSTIYEIFGALSSSHNDDTVRAGRYVFQSSAEKMALSDIIHKLQLEPTDTFLDIGCGPGTFLIPISFMVKEAHGIDHPGLLHRLKSRYSGQNLHLYDGPFPDCKPPVGVSKILIYNVLHALPSLDFARSFLLKALDLLLPGGRALVGDLPNSDLKRRFLGSDRGKALHEIWRQQRPSDEEANALFIGNFSDVETVGAFSEVFLLDIVKEIRELGFGAYLLPQPNSLPFGETREDLLIIKPT